jgi:aldehyde:ferredoxin oxidoreductase
MKGYAGKLLFVDLTTKAIEVRDLSEELARDFVGGPALGAKVLYSEMPPNTPPFAPESLFGFVSGPANGMGAFLGGRYTVVCKSPVTGGWNDANSGGTFGPAMRKAGYDAVFVRGISEKPVYIFIDSGEVSIRDASRLWGKTTIAAENAIKEELNDSKLGIALIAPAGERLSNIAAVMNDSHRAAARGGPGAVMGSKKLKALVVRGNIQIDAADKDAMVTISKEVAEWVKNPPVPFFSAFKQYGTSATYEGSVFGGDTSVKNWGGSAVDVSEKEVQALSGPEMDKLYRKKKYACHSCPAACGAIYEIKDEKWPLEDTGRPEYETLGVFGSALLNSDPVSVNKCNSLCNEYGYDTISMGSTIAWLMECYNNGLFTIDELDGIDLKWGNADAIVEIAERMCDNEGIGAILNGGSLSAAKHFNRGFEYLIVAGGIELPMHDPRFNPGMGSKYKYDPTPGRHVKGGYPVTFGSEPPEVKYDLTKSADIEFNGVVDVEFTNAAGFCKFGEEMFLPGDSRARYLSAITGFDFNPAVVRDFGLRSYAIRHAFNLREGFRRRDFDISPRSIGDPPQTEGPNEGRTIDIEFMADGLFKKLGYNLSDSVPTLETLAQLGGMEDVIRDLYPEAQIQETRR